jgi:hypothetical protein
LLRASPARASGPIPKFVSGCGTLDTNFGI